MYKTEIIVPKGLKVKGDDHTEMLANMITTKSNEYSKNGWRLLSVLPTVTSEGSLFKVLLIFEKL